VHPILKDNTAEKIIAGIPKDLAENLDYRVKLHDWLSKDVEAQKDYIALMLLYPVIAFDTLFWTLDVRKTNPAERNRQFVLRPQQEKVVNIVRDCVNQKFPQGENDLAIDKSREEGATELLMKYVTLLTMFVPSTVSLIGSRSEDLVDKTGARGTLFTKIDYTLAHLPKWLDDRLHFDRVFKTLVNLDIDSVVEGEATNESFGAGKRSTLLILDEFGRVLANLASAIADTVADITPCVIYNSTHFYGAGHPFAKLIRSGNIKVARLPWELNPEKNYGLYKSSEEGSIELVDKDYYFKNWPKVFEQIGSSFKILDYESCEIEDKPVFKADGCLEIDGDSRSPWHDAEEIRRSRRDLAMNVWRNPEGASDMFFDSLVNNRIRADFVTKPFIAGDFKLSEVTKSKIKKAVFVESVEKKFRWWGKLIEIDGELHPDKLHNFILGCDISFGTGASNSTVMIVDANTGELVGEYVSATLSPENFADMVCAIGMWIGGASKIPFLIWERNGGQGINFGRRIIDNGYMNVYTKTNETSKTRKRLQTFGWDSTGGESGTKQDLLTRLQIALKIGLMKKPDRTYIRVFSEEVVNELDSYMFYPSGEIDAGELIDKDSGARKRHGDRIIGLGLCVLALQDQPKAANVLKSSPPYGSFAWRQNQRKQKDALKKDNWGEKDKKTMVGWK